MQYPRHPGTWQGSETFTESTATASRRLSNDVEVSFIGMGTATAGHVHNLYHLVATTTATGVEGDAVEGSEKFIVATATGRADVYVAHPATRLPIGAMLLIDVAATGDLDQTYATATGSWVFLSADDWLRVKFMNGSWHFLDGVGPTMATAT